VTVAAPRRRIDLALPENISVAEMLPIVLRHGGEELADDGVEHGGWLLRRADGMVLSSSRTLGSHRIRDGEILHLVPGRQDWPELDYDDLVEAIAAGSRRRNRIWIQRHTRRAGLIVGAVAMSLAMVAVFRSGPNWAVASRWALGQAAILTLAAVVLARSLNDAAAGAMVGLLALPYAFVGGGLLMVEPGQALSMTSPRLEVACAALLLFALLGYLGVGDDGAPFVGAISAGLFGAVGAWLTGNEGMQPARSAAILIAVTLLVSPLFSSLAVWLGRLPMPTLPRSPADLLRDDPQPPRPAVYSAVARADGIFTGLLIGASAVAAVSALVIGGRTGYAQWLVILTTIGFVLRSRLYPIVRQRVPLLLAGLAGASSLLLGPGMRDPHLRLAATGPGLLGLGALAIMVGLAYSRRSPGPYLRRYVEVVEVLVTLAVVPIVCAVLGLYGRLRGVG
jgi:type VII secretion integral membrane protein EccD